MKQTKQQKHLFSSRVLQGHGIDSMADCTVGAQAMHEAVGEAQRRKANCKTRRKNIRRRKRMKTQDLQKTQDFCTRFAYFAKLVKEDLICKRY